MKEFPFSRASGTRKVEAENPGDAFPYPKAGRYCVYSQTRQRFLCANVEAADFSNLDARLPSLTPTSAAGLWIAPIQNISPTSIRDPLDLIYLDCNSVVLDAVESFPISQTATSIPSATSILALPAETISSTGTKTGDRLIVCSPEELKLRLQQISDSNMGTSSEQIPGSSGKAASVNDSLDQKAVGNVLPWVSSSNPQSPSEISPIALAPPEIAPTAPATVSAPPQTDTPAPRWSASTSKNWIQRLLSPEPSDPRKSPRTALPWLVAYFFTGGRPVPHDIRDVSVTGVFVFTEDRWYPGTVVRITLTDKRNPTAKRSITLNAEVIRSADDGVGFQFVLKDGKDSQHASVSGVDRQAQGVYRAEVEEFLLRMRSGGE